MSFSFHLQKHCLLLLENDGPVCYLRQMQLNIVDGDQCDFDNKLMTA